MPITTTIPGSPSSVRACATWFRSTLAPAVESYGDTVSSVRSRAGSDWDGDASEAFVAAMGTVAHKTDDVDAAAVSAAQEIDLYADGLETAQQAMSAIRTTAAGAGLTLTADQILEPGPGPYVPPRPACDGTASLSEVRAYDSAVLAHNAYVEKVNAYNRAVDDATAAMAAFDVAFDALVTYFERVAFSWTSWASYGVIATEVSFARYVSSVRTYADSLRQSAQWADEAYLRAPGGGPTARLEERMRFEAANRADEVARHADDLASGRMARLFGGKIPVIGTLVTIGGIGYDVSTGTSPSTAIVGGVTGALATAGVVAVVGGPVGWVAAAGIVVGVGVGLGAEWAWENWVPQDVRDKIDQGIADAWNATTGAISDAWDAIF